MTDASIRFVSKEALNTLRKIASHESSHRFYHVDSLLDMMDLLKNDSKVSFEYMYIYAKRAVPDRTKVASRTRLLILIVGDDVHFWPVLSKAFALRLLIRITIVIWTCRVACHSFEESVTTIVSHDTLLKNNCA